MKILQIVPTLCAGGAETFAVDLAIAQKDSGVNIEVLLLGGVRDARGELLFSRLKDAGVPCHGPKSRSARTPGNFLLFRRVIKHGDYDAIHAHLYSVELLLQFVLLLDNSRFNKPLLVRTLHNANIIGTRPKLVAYFLARRFDLNVACGERVKKNYEFLFGAERLITIENGIGLTSNESYIEGGGRLRGRLGIKAEDLVIACVGAFRGTSLKTSQKAQDLAIDSFSVAFGNRENIHLVFIGDGALKAEAQTMASRVNGHERIHFLGTVNDVSAILRDVSMIFISSRYEGLPIIGLEAACSGIPVLSSNIPELTEVGRSLGWQFPVENSAQGFADGLIEFVENISALQFKSLEAVGRARTHYGISRCASEYLAEISHRLLDRQSICEF